MRLITTVGSAHAHLRCAFYAMLVWDSRSTVCGVHACSLRTKSNKKSTMRQVTYRSLACTCLNTQLSDWNERAGQRSVMRQCTMVLTSPSATAFTLSHI
eukprot:6189243-Pleurochrysis_carterae.AAC.2